MTRRTKFQPSALLLAACAIGLGLLFIAAIGRAPNLRDFVFFQAGFLGLTAGPCLALYYLLQPKPAAPLPKRSVMLCLLLFLGLSLLLGALNQRLVQEILAIIERRFQHPSWHHLGLVLAAAVYLPLMMGALRRKWRERAYADFALAGGSLLFISSLYLPSGIHSAAHWESWIYRAFLEGQFSWTTFYELTTRFWVALPHLLGMLISPDSFAGFHVVNALMLWGKLLLLYAILRPVRFRARFRLPGCHALPRLPGEFGSAFAAVTAQSIQRLGIAGGGVFYARVSEDAKPAAFAGDLAGAGLQCRHKRDRLRPDSCCALAMDFVKAAHPGQEGQSDAGLAALSSDQIGASAAAFGAGYVVLQQLCLRRRFCGRRRLGGIDAAGGAHDRGLSPQLRRWLAHGIGQPGKWRATVAERPAARDCLGDGALLAAGGKSMRRRHPPKR